MSDEELEHLLMSALPFAVDVNVWRFFPSYTDLCLRNFEDIPHRIFDLLKNGDLIADGQIRQYQSKEAAEADLTNAVNLYRSQR